MNAADLWLDPESVEALTGRKRYRAQCRALAKMGIAFRPNAIGRPLVELRAVVSSPAPAPKKAGPNWDALKHGKAA